MDKGGWQKGARTTPFTTHEIQFQSTHGPSLSGDKQKLMHFCRITANTPWCHSSLSLSQLGVSLFLAHYILLPFLFWSTINWNKTKSFPLECFRNVVGLFQTNPYYLFYLIYFFKYQVMITYLMDVNSMNYTQITITYKNTRYYSMASSFLANIRIFPFMFYMRQVLEICAKSRKIKICEEKLQTSEDID